jgi:hypothetical protein
LRESYRENGKVKSRTLANLSRLLPPAIEMPRRHFKGQNLVPAEQALEIIEDGSPAHGHVDAVMIAMRRLGFSILLSTRPSQSFRTATSGFSGRAAGCLPQYGSCQTAGHQAGEPA